MAQGHLLLVDDSTANLMFLSHHLQGLGFKSTTANSGLQALERLAELGLEIDCVLLDVMMPDLSGLEVLRRIKDDPRICNLPVLMVSALDELTTVVECIERGAEDYLIKPYEPALLRARLMSCLTRKRLWEQSEAYLRDVELLTQAAASVESATFSPSDLDSVATRSDALGGLARIFTQMVVEMRGREQRLRQQLEQLRRDREESLRRSEDTVLAYLPMDRRQALAHDRELPLWGRGTVLFADLSGFTARTEALTEELGAQAGAEEITRQLNRVLALLIGQVHAYRGSVLCLSGDAITAWFVEDGGRRAVSCALAMQKAMEATPDFSVKVSVAEGAVVRMLVGDPEDQVFEVIAGDTLARLFHLERLTRRGEVVLQPSLGALLPAAQIVERHDDRVLVAGEPLEPGVAWPSLPEPGLTPERARAWLSPSVFERVLHGQSEFLCELRPSVALFLQIAGLETDQLPERLDPFVRWVQAVLRKYGGSMLQITLGEKGGYLYAAFGALSTHPDDATRAALAALELREPPEEFRVQLGVGLASGMMRVGAYGGSGHRAYGVIGGRTNLAARLMERSHGRILCEQHVYEATREHMEFEELTALLFKGFAQSTRTFELKAALSRTLLLSRMDQLPGGALTVLKLAAVAGCERPFAVRILERLATPRVEKGSFPQFLGMLTEERFLSLQDGFLSFPDPFVRETAYERLLFAQRRELHRVVAEWYEQSSMKLTDFAELGRHWLRAGDPDKALHYLQIAADWARHRGRLEEAQELLEESLRIEQEVRPVDEPQ